MLPAAVLLECGSRNVGCRVVGDAGLSGSEIGSEMVGGPSTLPTISARQARFPHVCTTSDLLNETTTCVLGNHTV